MWIIAYWGGPSFVGPFSTKQEAKRYLARHGDDKERDSVVSVCRLSAVKDTEATSDLSVSVLVNLPDNKEDSFHITCHTLKYVQMTIEDEYPDWTSYVLTVTRE